MSQHNDFSPSDPNLPSSPGFANFQTQPGGFTSLLGGNTNTQSQPHQQALSEWQQFRFWQWQQQQSQTHSSYQPQTQSFHQPQTQSFHQPQTQSFQQPQTQPFQLSQSFQPQQALMYHFLFFYRKLTVPQRTFTHFYAVGVFWTTMLLVAVWFYAITMLPSLTEHGHTSNMTSQLHKSMSTREHVYNVWLSVFMLLLMEAQVLRRFYESINVFNYSPSARMHIVGYFVGIFYYIATPLSLCCKFAPEVFDFVKNMGVELIVRGNDSIWRSEIHIWMFVTPFLSLGWFAWIGAVIFFWGWLHQLRCHQILGSMRKKPENQGEYFIPNGDWFEYVSSPHYTAEIVIYGGLLVASGGADLSLWLLFAFVVTNLGFAAMITHKWYVQKFEDYPPNRRAIFPFIY